jgi:PAS domain S-box-containing protein
VAVALPSVASRGLYDDWTKRVRPEDLLVFEASIQEAFRKKHHRWQTEYRMMGSDTAEDRWINSQGRIFYDGQREPLRMIGVNIDTTERKRIEQELKAANAFLDAIIENIPLMLFIKESQSLRFIRVNRTGEDLLGWPNQTLIGKTAYDFWPKEQAEFFIEKDRETLTNGSVVDIPEEPIQTRHQGVRLLHTKKVPIRDTAGHPMYLLGISEDITERKRIEKERQVLAEVSVELSS